jgi:hypothetical protein
MYEPLSTIQGRQREAAASPLQGLALRHSG